MSKQKPRLWVSQPFFEDIIGQLGEHFELEMAAETTNYDSATLANKLATVDAAIVSLSEKIAAAEIANAKQLRALATVSVGYNNLDIAALSEAGIVASNTPDVLTETTADLGFALLMAAARRLSEGERWLRAGNWKSSSFTRLLGADIHGATLGILGMGRIGQAIARRGHHGFGMNVLYHNRSRLPEATEAEVGATLVGLDELLQRADHLVLVLPYTPQNHHIIDAAALAKMKPTAVLVNVARGGIVDEVALADALANGRLAAAGLDVYEGEPTVRPELLALENVVMSPHIGSATLATRRAMVQLAVDSLLASMDLGPNAGNPPSAINLEAAKAAAAGKR